MARKEPELFYHPVMGGFSPATIGLLNLQAFKPPSARDQHHHPIKAEAIQTEAVKETKAAPVPAPAPEAPRPVESSALDTPHLAPYSERKAMSLTKTAVCAVSGEILPQNRMIRFVISPDHQVLPDLTGKLPGKFVWVSAERHALKKAIWRNCFASHVRDAVEIPSNLLDLVEFGLNRQALQALSLSKRAGELIFGYTKTGEALRSHAVQVYVVAADSSENGREKLERLARHQELPVIDVWTSAELSAAIGEKNVNHLALVKGGLSQMLLELVTKLNSVRSEK